MKKFYYMLICVVMAISFVGCDSKQETNDKPQNEIQNNQDDKNVGSELDVKEVEEYLPQDDKYRFYNGYAEAGFEIKFVSVEEDEDGTEYKYIGAMNDERGTIDDKPRTFEVTYTIENGKVIENVDNDDYMGNGEDRLYSRVEDMVVLSGAIEEGNSWEQPIEIDGVKTTLRTTITAVGEDSFTTISHAEAEGYKNGEYTEERTYTKGKGLTSFNNTPYGSDEDDTLIFGYGFSTEGDSSITGMI